METFAGFDPRLNMSGFTAIPNAFFDDVLMNISSLAELKVILSVFRKTYGWISHIDPTTGQVVYKEHDEISMSQFREITGLSQPSCVEGVKRAIEHGYIERVKEGTFHGGDSTYNEAAAYRIKQKTETPTEPKKTNPPAEKKKTDIEQTIKTIEKRHTKKDVGFSNESDKADSKEDILAELFGKPEEPTPKKKEPKTFKNKKLEDWNGRDLMAYFNTKYREILGFSAGPMTVKDQTLAKTLLEGYETADLVKSIDYYLANYKDISYLPAGHPGFNIFFGFRRSIIPEAIDPTSAKKKGGVNKDMREFDGNPNGDDGGYEW